MSEDLQKEPRYEDSHFDMSKSLQQSLSKMLQIDN